MKTFALIFFSLLQFYNSFSQEIFLAKTADDYRQMSKNQQIGGIILLGAGVTTLAIASQADISFDDLPTVIIIGSLATLGGTALLIASGKNKNKSHSLTANLGFKKPSFKKVTAAKTDPIPTVSFQMRF